jgi:Ser/Thr protein kinase RdoA (MazF antagonist)
MAMEQDLKVHGLNNNWTEPDWPFLTLAEVDTLLQRFPSDGGADRILSFSPRPFSAASVVETPRGRVFVKRHHRAVRNRDGLLEEHRLLQHLHARGGIVPAVLVNDSGESAIATDEWTYEVHSIADGVDLYEQELSWTPFHSTLHARAAGRALAELHAALEDYDAPPRRTQSLVTSFNIFAAQEPWPMLEQFVASRPELAKYLAARDWQTSMEVTLMPFHAKLRPLLASLRPSWTHNDFHASNLFWSSAAPDAEVRAIIDFGLADRTTAVHDLATAIERNGVRWLSLDGQFDEVVHLDHILSLLRGYEQIRPLSASEAHALVAVLPLVHAEFALSEADYFLRVLHSEKKAALAWDGYFLGHAAWFQSENGLRLLEHLEAWAGGERRGQHVIS